MILLQSSSASRVTARASQLFILSQSGERPERFDPQCPFESASGDVRISLLPREWRRIPEAFEALAVKREAEDDCRQEPGGALLTLPALGEGRHRSLAGGLIARSACDPHACRSIETAPFHHDSRRRGGRVAAAGRRRRRSRRSAFV